LKLTSAITFYLHLLEHVTQEPTHRSEPFLRPDQSINAQIVALKLQ